jgi:hypothetical protein
MGAFPFYLSEVSAPDVSRVWGALDPPVGVGQAYYDHQQNDKNREHHAAVRSLAFKWIRIIFRCWKDTKPYDEEIYMQSLRRRGSLLADALGLATSAGWKSVAGFQKLSDNNT